jgi:FkbM family methyltransferase
VRLLGWRYNLLRESWFYFRCCQNWRQVLDARRTGAPFNQFRIRNGPVIAFEGKPPFIIFRDIWDKRVYLHGFSPHFGPPTTVVDVGANIGIFSLFAAWYWRQADVLAYEPAPKNYQCLAANVARSNASRIKTFPLAVGHARTTQVLYLKPEAGWHSLIPDERSISQVLVETIDLSAVVDTCEEQRIDFLKIDCEGAEYQIVQGNEALLERHVTHLAMEYHEFDDHRVGELEGVLNNAGFVIQLFPLPGWKTGMLIAHNKSLSKIE